MITVYSMEGCAACVSAVALLSQKGSTFEVVKIEDKPEAWDWLKNQGLRSMPQIYEDDVLIPGGFQGLVKKLNK